MKTFFKLLIFAFLFIPLGLVGEEPGMVKVGVIAPLTGQYARLGLDAQRAIKLSAKGDSRLEFVYEDSQFKAPSAISAYRQLIEFKKIDILINLDSVSFKVLHPLIKRDGILTFQLAESVKHEKDPVYQMMPFSFSLYSELGKVSDEKFDRIALIYGSSEFLVLDAEYFKKGVSKDKIVFEEMLPSQPDYRTIAAKLLKKRPQAATFFLNPEDGVQFLKALKEQNAFARLSLICDANTEINFPKYTEALGAEIFEGCLSTGLPNRMTEEFQKMFKEAYGEDPAPFSDYAYDAASLIKLVIAQPRSKWRSVLNSVDTRGASGRMRFDEHGTRYPDFEVRVVKKGKFVPVP